MGNERYPTLILNVSPVQLQYLLAALEHDSWKQASAALGVTPSAFSQGLRELERRLGVPLFDKQGRGRVPTNDAHEAARRAGRVLDQLGELQRWADDVRSGSTGLIRAGMIDTAAVHHLGDALVAYRRQYPDVALRLAVRPSGELIGMLRSGELDVIVAVDLAGLAPQIDDLDVHPLVAEALHVYAPEEARVAKPDTWGPWVTFPQESRTRRLIERGLHRVGARFEVVAESSQPEVLREMVRLGMGWTVLSAVDAEREPRALRPAVPTQVAERVLSLATRRDRTPSRSLAQFITHLLSS